MINNSFTSRSRGAGWLLLLLIAIGSRSACAQATQPVRPLSSIEHVMIVSIDGCRPDVLLRTDAPACRELMKTGSFTMWAKTTAQSITLPSHVSMLTGVRPESHGVMWNSDLPFKEPVYSKADTLFDIAKKAGYTTMMCAGKDKFDIFDKPGSLDWKYFPTGGESYTHDAEVTDKAIPLIRDHRPTVMFVHLPDTDSAGHGKGWGTDEQLAAVAGADKCIGRLVDALKDAKIFNSTLIIISADHGGAGRAHGPEDPRSRTIPWIISGPGIRANYDLSLQGRDSDVQTFDTFATSAYVLGLKSDKKIVGIVQTSAFIENELLIPVGGPSAAPAMGAMGTPAK